MAKNMILRMLVLLYIYHLNYAATAQKCNNRSPCQFTTGEALRHPPQLLSKSGQLQVTLKVEMSKVTVGGWLELWRRAYNGKIGGPTWRVKPGDSITVNLINALGPNAADNSQNKLRLANSTNLYVHGLHVSLQTNDATNRIDPGQRRTYAYKIDCQHPPGTYWYHPHVHGSTMFQTLSGMAGMIVVEDEPAQNGDSTSISSYSCPEHCDHEIHLLFQPTMLYKIGEDGFSFSRVQKRIRDDSLFRNRQRLLQGSTLEDWLINRENNVQYFTTNGQIQPKLRIEAGKTMRFRMVNAGGLHVLEIGVPVNKRGASCHIQEIARDGIYLPHPTTPRHGTSILPQGGTLDWIIRCDTPGSYTIESNPNSRDNPALGRGVRFRGLLASIEIVRTPLNFKKSSFVAKFDDDVPMILPAPPRYMPNLMSVNKQSIEGKFVVETAGNNLLNRGKYSSPDNSIRHQMPLDGVQEWTLLNADPSNAHTLHVQGNHFQIIAHNEYIGPISITSSGGKHHLLDKMGKFCKTPEGQRTPKIFAKKRAWLGRSKYSYYSASGLAQPGQWRNTIILPPLSNITVRLLPRHYVGKAMIYSHNLLRDDLGMKMLIEIIEKGSTSMKTATISQEAGMPGTCKPDDFYPSVYVPKFSLGTQNLVDFFSWLYSLKPMYKKKYGDQRYLSGLYGAYLRQLTTGVSDGHHLKDFFSWAYDRFPNYRDYYGDQSYLCELYDFYITKNVTPKHAKKSFATN